MSKILPPRTVLKLVKLWPHARKHGHEKGDIHRVGYYCKKCGIETVWLVNHEGKYDWTADKEWIEKHFIIVEFSKERSVFGKGRPKLTPLTKNELHKYKSA